MAQTPGRSTWRRRRWTGLADYARSEFPEAAVSSGTSGPPRSQASGRPLT